ncbi:MAG: 16S rRNA (cytidine(1402)-2'-O)-methyltransferase [Acidimicrobiales bacterium]
MTTAVHSPDREPAGAAQGGQIVLVGTPIGNLGDLSPRAVAALAGADTIACEDTRVARRLLSHARITGKRLVTMNAHTEAAAAPALVARAGAGEVVAVVTDAGMPAVSDPGARLVQAAAAAGVEVTVVPGPSSVLAALVLSGLAADRFCFEGFLARKGGKRAAQLASIAAEPRTSVLMEAPPRVRALLSDLAAACGPDRPVAVARELTKLHEEVWRGALSDAVAWIEVVEPRGEYVVVVGPAPQADAVDVDDDAITAALREKGGSKAAVAAVTAALGVPRRRVYDLAVALRKSDGQRTTPR